MITRSDSTPQTPRARGWSRSHSGSPATRRRDIIRGDFGNRSTGDRWRRSVGSRIASVVPTCLAGWYQGMVIRHQSSDSAKSPCVLSRRNFGSASGPAFRAAISTSSTLVFQPAHSIYKECSPIRLGPSLAAPECGPIRARRGSPGRPALVGTELVPVDLIYPNRQDFLL